jgi:hypothetical protein
VKGLLLRLSAVDADAEAAVRVIAYFDVLVDRSATPVELLCRRGARRVPGGPGPARCEVAVLPAGRFSRRRGRGHRQLLALLAEVPPERLRAQPDVAALDALAATDVAALAAFCRTGSLRKAAAVLHLHHSSVAARLAHVEKELGWRLDEPDDRFRARFALLARRLSRA